RRVATTAAAVAKAAAARAGIASRARSRTWRRRRNAACAAPSTTKRHAPPVRRWPLWRWRRVQGTVWAVRTIRTSETPTDGGRAVVALKNAVRLEAPGRIPRPPTSPVLVVAEKSRDQEDSWQGVK
ncbi:unnamed protein product, partial [Ectocarpus sp. 12 AP-2014]